MRRCKLVATIAIGILGAFIVPTVADDQASCFAGGAGDENIAACSRFIASSTGKAADLVRGHTRRAFLLARRGREADLDQAIADADAVLRRDPSNAIALALRAAARIRKNDLDRAYADLNDGMRISPQSTTVRNVFGQYYLARGDYDRALAELNEAIRLSATNHFAYRTRGITYEKKGEFAQALADFRVALRADPDRKENLGREAAEGIERVQNALNVPPPQPTLQPSARRGELSVNGRVRTYQVAAAAMTGPRPTIIHLHGAGGSGAREAQATSGLGQIAPRNGFTAVFPDGLGARWNYFPAAKVPSSYKQSFQDLGGIPDDVAFIRMLVADLVRGGVSDSRRIYLVGTSAGGIMALRMVCTDAGLFAAVATLIAGMPESVGDDCRPEKPIPTLMLSGTADRFLPYGGGPITSADPRLISGELGAVWSMEHLSAFFRQLNTCTGPPETSSLSGFDKPIEIVTAGRCLGGPVQFYRVVGGGHEVPGSLGLGPRLLDFFRDKAR